MEGLKRCVAGDALSGASNVGGELSNDSEIDVTV